MTPEAKIENVIARDKTGGIFAKFNASAIKIFEPMKISPAVM